MRRRVGQVVIVVVVLLATFAGGVVAADEELTLAGLAEQLMELAERVAGLAEQVEELEATNAAERLAALETMVAPTPTPTATPEPTMTPTPTPTATPDQTPRFAVARERVNVRSGPGTGFEVVGQLVQGDSYEIEGRNPAGDWYVFEFEGQRGWIYAPMLEVENRLAIPITKDVPSQQTPTPVPPTSTPTKRPTPVPTATPISSQACDFESFEFIDAEDVSYASVTRLVGRFSMGIGCVAEDAVAYALVHATLLVTENDEIDAIGYHFYCNADSVNEGSNVSVDFAPFGDWSKAGETRQGDYSEHEAALQFSRGVPCP